MSVDRFETAQLTIGQDSEIVNHKDKNVDLDKFLEFLKIFNVEELTAEQKRDIARLLQDKFKGDPNVQIFIGSQQFFVGNNQIVITTEEVEKIIGKTMDAVKQSIGSDNFTELLKMFFGQGTERSRD